MEALINDFVREHFAGFVVCTIIALTLFGLALWFVFSYITFKKHAKCEEHQQRLDDMGNACRDLPCKTHGEKLEAHGLEAHGLEVQSLKTSIEYLNKNLERINSQMSNTGMAFTQQHSPLRITEKGMEVVKKLGIDKMFERNWSTIRAMIDNDVEQKNAYDINDYCIKYAVVYPEKFLQPEELTILKNDAYARGAALMDYMKIIAVMARDEYFKEKGIKIDDIDEE